MSAFAAAVATVAADPNLGVDAVLTPTGNDAVAVSLRVVPHQPEAPFGGADVPRSLTRMSEVTVAVAALAGNAPRGATLAFGGSDYTVEEATKDARGVSYLLRLRRA